MKLTLPPPFRRKRTTGLGAALDAVGSAAQTVGSAVDTVRTIVPDTVRKGSARARAAKLGAPVAGVAVAAIALARRKRNRAAVEEWNEGSPAPPQHEAPATQTERRKEEATSDGPSPTEGATEETPRNAAAETPAAAEAGEGGGDA
jgi:hypothetical protein